MIKPIMLKNVFANTRAAIDLVSVMVGIIVLGVIGGIIAATIFALIPWSQDRAAKAQLGEVVTAQAGYLKNLADDPTVGRYGSAAQLTSSSLLPTVNNLCVVTSNGSSKYYAAILSGSGKYFSITDSDTTPKVTAKSDLNCTPTASSATASPTSSPTDTSHPVWNIPDPTLHSSVAALLSKSPTATLYLDSDAVNFNNSLMSQLNVTSAVTTTEGLQYAAGNQLDNVDLASAANPVGLTNVTNIVGNLNIATNDYSGFTALQRVSGRLSFYGPNITTISGFANLNSVGDGVYFSKSDGTDGDSNLTSITGFANLTSITGSVYMVDDPKLATINALNVMTTVSGDIKIDTTNFTSFNAFNAMHTVNGAITLTNEPVTNINFQALRSVGTISLSNVSGTLNTGFDSLTNFSAAGGITVKNTTLTSLTTFNSVATLAYFDVESNPNLVTINSMNHLASSNTLEVSNNPALQTLTAFGLMANTTSYVHITSDPVLNTLTGFGSMATVSGDLTFSNLPALTQMPAFPALGTVGGNLNLATLGVNSITGFPSLTKINGNMIINSSNETAITGFNSLTTVTGTVLTAAGHTVNISVNGTNLTNVTGFAHLAANTVVEVQTPKTGIDWTPMSKVTTVYGRP